MLPPFVLINRCSAENRERQVYSACSSANVAESTMVQQYVQTSNKKTNSLTTPSINKSSMGSRIRPPELRTNSAYWHYLVGRRLFTQGFVQSAVQIFINGFDKSTIQTYGGWAKEWLHYCFELHIDPLRPMARDTVNFISATLKEHVLIWLHLH